MLCLIRVLLCTKQRQLKITFSETEWKNIDFVVVSPCSFSVPEIQGIPAYCHFTEMKHFIFHCVVVVSFLCS